MTKQRTRVPVALSNMNEARALFRQLRSRVKEALEARFRGELDVVVAEPEDRTLSEELGVADEKNTWLDQSFQLYAGMLSGVSARFYWAPDEPAELVVDTGPYSRIEDHAMTVLIGVPAVLTSVAGFLFLRWPILGGILGALAGGLVGAVLYGVTAEPLFGLFLRGKRGQCARAVREVHAILCEEVAPAEPEARAAA